MFKSRRMHFIHLNVYSVLLNIKETLHLAELTKASLIGISEMKIDESVLNSLRAMIL